MSRRQPGARSSAVGLVTGLAMGLAIPLTILAVRPAGSAEPSTPVATPADSIAGAKPPCGPAHAFPAYLAHDWKGKRPRLDALELGYLGVEADVVLVKDMLHLAADPKQVGNDAGLEATYLWHLLDRIQSCPRLLPDARPFLVLIHDHAPTTESRLLLATLLARHRALLRSAGGSAIAEFVLTDSGATPAGVPEELKKSAGLEWRVTSQQPVPPGADGALYRLLGIDYRKEIGWDGDGRPPAAATKMVSAAVSAAKGLPGVRVRVYNLPSSRRVWTWLLDAGVDLIGVDDPAEGVRLLADRAK